jgi:hypothetical protein
MGWRGALRSAAAASRRAAREDARIERAKGRLLTKVERDAGAVVRKAKALEARMEKNIVKALGLRYSPGSGFESEPFDIGSGLMSGELRITDDGATFQFSPSGHEIGAAKIELLDMMILKQVTVLAVRVTNDDPAYHVSINWVHRTDRTRSPIKILDQDNSLYYFPVATD